MFGKTRARFSLGLIILLLLNKSLLRALCNASLIMRFSSLAGKNRFSSQRCVSARQCPLSELLGWFFLFPSSGGFLTYMHHSALCWTCGVDLHRSAKFCLCVAFSFLTHCLVNSSSLVSLDSQFLNSGGWSVELCLGPFPEPRPAHSPKAVCGSSCRTCLIFSYCLWGITGPSCLMSSVLKTIVWNIYVSLLFFGCFRQDGKSRQNWKS